MAHIVAESPSGPRGDATLSTAERNRYENLILLCNTHHQLVDSQPKTWSVERLRGIKEDHEKWVERTLGFGSPTELPAAPRVTDKVYSSLLPVEAMPPSVFSAPCSEDESYIKRNLGPRRRGEVTPFIVRDGQLHVFQNLKDHTNPFVKFADPGAAQRTPSKEWWADPDRLRWFVELLNRTMNKLAGRRQLHWERERKRYYFARLEDDATGDGERSVQYRPLNRKTAVRRAVWQPRSRATGEAHGYWIHRAVTLRFLYFGESDWCLSLRPEIKVTADGTAQLPFEKNTRAINQIISRWFNDKYLGEVHFWRDYLGQSTARIVLGFGSDAQQLRISTNLVDGSIEWPGIPPEFSKPFANAQYPDEEDDPPLHGDSVERGEIEADQDEADPDDLF